MAGRHTVSEQRATYVLFDPVAYRPASCVRREFVLCHTLLQRTAEPTRARSPADFLAGDNLDHHLPVTRAIKFKEQQPLGMPQD
jgi:hypothetical protein